MPTSATSRRCSATRCAGLEPHDLTPVEFVELNFDFHPEHIRRELIRAGFAIQSRLPVSLFRLEQLKDTVSVDMLARLDGLFQSSGLLVTPSVFVRSIAVGSTPNNLGRDMLFACPECGGDLARHGDTITCLRDGLRWAIRDGIYDFKAPLEADE
ncbi:MAG: hypothetical protein LC121_25855 [Anaerolineae bacterium]|nr:hypothetical protein [Anaerolineae bacterium]